MNIKTLNKVIASVLLTGSLAIASSAQATVITSSYTNAFEVTEISQTGSLSQFDSALGTLNSATLTLSGESLSSTILINNAAGMASFDFNSILNFFFDVSSVGVTIPLPAFVTQLASTSGFVGLASGVSLNLGPVSDIASYSVTLTGSDLAAFVGTGLFDTSCNTISGSSFTGGGGNISNDQTTTAFCSASISYDYTETTLVSAPASALLFGAGMLGLAVTRRNKKTS
ncbi:MAG: choice-of-anchor E domain-containing protein [Paraglaciecola sp.]|nr:choice-of-anchor E domain-containing protein [Paraglaciecola sp.]